MKLKIITGTDGYKAKQIADDLRQAWPVSAENAYNIAFRRIASIQTLVVMTANKIIYEGDDEISPRYRETFKDPRFNPRFEDGFEPEFVEIVDF